MISNHCSGSWSSLKLRAVMVPGMMALHCFCLARKHFGSARFSEAQKSALQEVSRSSRWSTLRRGRKSRKASAGRAATSCTEENAVIQNLPRLYRLGIHPRPRHPHFWKSITVEQYTVAVLGYTSEESSF